MITLRDLNGIERQVPDGQPYVKKPGEEVIKGNGGSSREERQVMDTLGQLAKSRGIPYGDYIAKVTAALHIPHCSRCEQKRLIFNRFHELGVLKTLQLLKEIR